MQVFKVFMKITKKNLVMASIYVGIFLVIALIISQSNNEDTFTATKLRISVIDQDHSKASLALTDYIGSKHNLVTIKDDKDTMLDALYNETTHYVLRIKEGYEEKLKNNDTDDLFDNYQVHSWYGGTLFELDLNEYVTTLASYLVGGNELSAAITKTTAALQEEVTVDTISFDTKSADSPADYGSGIASFFRYLPYVFLSLLITLLCPVLTTIYSKEISNRTNCSSTTLTKFNLQIFLGSGVLIVIIWILFMAMASGMNGMFVGRAWLAVLNSFVFIMVAAGIAILLAIFSPSTQVMNVIANVVSLGMSFLCGIFVPQSMLGENVLRFAKFLPAYWYAKANDLLAGISTETYTSTRCLQYIGIEAVFVVALFAVILLLRKVKQEAKI